MTDLTEQWKKGELPDGEYYIHIHVNCKNGYDGIETAYFYGNTFHTKEFEWFDAVKEVLARVPSYQKFLSDQMALKTYESPEIQKILIDWRTGEFDRKFNKLEAENTKLKELLKESREPLEVLAEKKDACDWYPEEVLAKLYQALGEDK